VIEAFYPELIAPSEVPAFPIDKERYQKHALQFHFQQQYHRAVADLLAQLGPRPRRRRSISRWKWSAGPS